MRRSRAEGRNVVLVGPGTTPQELSDAVFGLLAIEILDPSGLKRGDHEAVRIRPTSRPAFPWAKDVLDQLTSADSQDTPGLGRHPTVRVWVEPLRGATGRGKGKKG